MENNPTISEDQLTAMTASVEELRAHTKTLNEKATAGEKSEYVVAFLSFSYAGAQEAEMQGWITYKESDIQLYCSGQGEMIHGAPIAQGVPQYDGYVLPADKLLNANRCTWEASGHGLAGILVIRADDKIISRFQLNSAGWGIGHWKVRGVCKFQKG